MAKNWNYANLAHVAKESGGPERYLQIVKHNSYQLGRRKQLMVDGGIGLGVGFIYLGSMAYRHFKKRRAMAKQAEEAEQIMIERMNEAIEKEEV